MFEHSSTLGAAPAGFGYYVADLHVHIGRTSDSRPVKITAARDHDRAEAVVLGCAGMSDMCADLTRATGVPVIDGVHAAVRLAEALAGGGYRTAKTGAYGWPRDKSQDLAGHVARRHPAA